LGLSTKVTNINNNLDNLNQQLFRAKQHIARQGISITKIADY